MLPELAELVAVSVEGPASNSLDGIPDEEVIDVAEYYGGETIETCNHIDYIQLKHSTIRTEQPWQLSELRDTLSRFGNIFRSEVLRSGLSVASSKLRFKIVSNRPFGQSLLTTSGGRVRITDGASRATQLSGSSRADFEKIFSLEGTAIGYLGQGLVLRNDLNGYLAADDEDAPLRLREMVAQKALSHNADRNVIRRSDLLGALQVSSDDLLPSPNLIGTTISYPRAQESEFVSIIAKSSAPVVIHAAGGVGKSMLASRIPALLPEGSVSVIFDCFGNGSYREPGRTRHTVHRSLPQIVNELAAQRMCDLLVPSQRVSSDSYFRSFAHRLEQCSRALYERAPGAVVCLIVDAADNSEMAAQEAADGPSALKRIFRLPLPHNVRLVATSRTERLDLLELPSNVQLLSLNNFNEEESKNHLRRKHPGASDLEVNEFHRLTSANPRVQATVLAEDVSLKQLLASLAGTPLTVDETIGASLQRTLGRVFDGATQREREHIRRLLEAIATLRPFIPIDLLAALAQVSRSLVETFAADFGRPLLLLNDALQFRDEPTETWFRERYRPSAARLAEFAAVVEEEAASHPYAAVALPQLLLETGQADRLIVLALAESALPSNPTERRSIQVQRLLFALRAALRSEKYVEAAKLAFKAAQEVSGAGRQANLLALNLDLVVQFRPPHRARELVGTQTFEGDWLGTRHVCQAALYARLPGSEGEANSQLRLAEAWLRYWAEDRSEGSHAEIPDVLKAEIAEVHWRVSGATACIHAITRWVASETRFAMARIITRRSLDAGRVNDVLELLAAAKKQVAIEVAIIGELHSDGRSIDRRHLGSVVRRLSKTPFRAANHLWESVKNEIDIAVVRVIEAAIHTGAGDAATLLPILEPFVRGARFHDFSLHDRQRRFFLIRSFVLHSRLADEAFTIRELTARLTANEGDRKHSSETREQREFKETAAALLPWHALCVDLLFNPKLAASLPEELSKVRERVASTTDRYWGRNLYLSDDIGVLWMWLLRFSGSEDKASSIAELRLWSGGQDGINFIPTWITMTRLASAAPGLHQLAYEFARKATKVIEGATLHATDRADSLIKLSRAILRMDRREAEHYFDKAIETVSKLGDEVAPRWRAVLDVADTAAGIISRGPELAYRLSRCAEFVYEYQSNHFDWESTISSVALLSPASAVCIASRWNDRRFGWPSVILETLFRDLRTRRLATASWVNPFLRLVSFRDGDLLLEQMLEDAVPGERQRLFRRAITILELEQHGVAFWNKLKVVGEHYNLPTDHIVQRIGLEEDYERYVPDDYAAYPREDQEKSLRAEADETWSKNRLAEQIYCSADILAAREVWADQRERGVYLSEDLFIERLFRDARGDRAIEIIEAVASSSPLSATWQRRFFEMIPSEWMLRHSVCEAIRTAALAVARRHCLSTSRSRYRQDNLFDSLSRVSGLKRELIAREALRAAAEFPVIDDAETLFDLIGHVTFNLDIDGAEEVLDFAVGMIEVEMPDDTGDGQWHHTLAPGHDVDKSLAGFIYAQLASPKAGERWRAAHAVVELGLSPSGHQSLESFVEFDTVGGHEAYADASLPFYALHARLWLLIALSRIAKERPERLITHVNWLQSIAFEEQHVLIREFAKQILIAIVSVGSRRLDRAGELRDLNRSPFPFVSERPSLHQAEADMAAGRSDKESFLLGYDVSRYWLGPLDRIFSHKVGTSERVCQRLISERWFGRFSGSYKDDPRQSRKIFREQETWHSHGNYPKTDDLNTYVCFHALMMTAGELLRTTAVRRVESETEDGFTRWLGERLLTRPDGMWLADGRGPEPSDLFLSGKELNDAEWKWAVSREDFARYVIPDAHHIVLNGRWAVVRGHRVERVTVNSILVPRHTTDALLRSLENGDPAADRGIFDQDDEADAVHPDFRLRRWSNSVTYSRNLDEYDPWAGSVSCEVVHVGDIVTESFGGRIIRNGDTWVSEDEGGAETVLHSETWGRASEREDDETPRPYGARIVVSPKFLLELLDRTSMKMMIKITVQRELHSHHYQKGGDDRYVYIPPYFLYHVFEAPTSDGK